MQMISTIEVRLHVQPEALVAFRAGLEVSLDCPICLRTRRTVVFSDVSGTAYCTPTQHQFPGCLQSYEVGKQGSETRISYVITHEAVDFEDPKDHYTSVRHATWARVHFKITCPRCNKTAEHSIQNNIHRPSLRKCECGITLYEDQTENPVFITHDATGTLVYDHKISEMIIVLMSEEHLSLQTRQVLSESIECSWQEISDRMKRGEPIYQQAIYHIEEPIKFSNNLQKMVYALLSDDATFDVMQNGRSLKSSYRHRMAKS